MGVTHSLLRTTTQSKLALANGNDDEGIEYLKPKDGDGYGQHLKSKTDFTFVKSQQTCYTFTLCQRFPTLRR